MDTKRGYLKWRDEMEQNNCGKGKQIKGKGRNKE